MTAALIDLDFFIRRYRYFHPSIDEESPEVRAKIIAHAILNHINNHLTYKDQNHTLFRIYVYDCPPLSIKHTHPKTNKTIDFSKTDMALFRNALHTEIKKMPLTALRLGKLDKNHIKWIITNKKKYNKLLRGEITIDMIDEHEFKLDFQQKQVDMKIGMDITWITLKKLVDQIILISGDSDFVPVAKLARREGIIFVLDALHHNVSEDLSEHIDFLRTPRLDPPSKLITL